MKKIAFLLLAIMSISLMSCTADSIPAKAKSAEDIGGQSGGVPPPPPPATKP